MSFESFCQSNKIGSNYFDCNINNIKDLQLAAALFFKKPHSIILYGEPGSGKTYFILAIIRHLLEEMKVHPGYIRFLNALDLDDKVEEYIQQNGSAKYFIDGLKEIYYLFIDDFGIEKSKDRAERNYYALLDSRLSNNMPTIISSNLSEAEILAIYGARIHSRLKQCITLHLTGDDHRKQPNIF